MRTFALPLLLLIFACACSCQAGNATQWTQRTIYQLMTDRFGGVNTPCPNLNDYCGGTFWGIQEHLNYIAGMGFDAIWISPVVQNTPGGYHGYWAANFSAINPYFGSAATLQAFVSAAHAMDIWVMVDIVANHVGPVGTDYASIFPFSQNGDYHPDCAVTNYTCFTSEVYVCRLESLPDLDQDGNPAVAQALYDWIGWLIATFKFDGIRADTVMYIEQSFWVGFQQAAGVYIVGEVWSDVQCCIAYQKYGIDATLSYPMYDTLISVFQQGQSMNEIAAQVQAYAGFPNPQYLGTFIDNQDNPRFLSGCNSCVPQYLNALAYVLLAEGVPIVYYGTEQLFNGGTPPANREPLWPSGYATDGYMYAYLTSVIGIRKTAQVWNYSQIQRYASTNFYAFTRGNVCVCLTNTQSPFQILIQYHPYSVGTVLCNALDALDCVTVTAAGFTVYMQQGLPKIYMIASDPPRA